MVWVVEWVCDGVSGGVGVCKCNGVCDCMGGGVGVCVMV